MDPKEAIQRMRRGQALAAERRRDLARDEGPRSEQAVAEALAAAAALARGGVWPAPRDPVSEAQVAAVRARWVKIERHGQRAAG